MEIIKREFENHQKESWRLEDEKLRKKLAKKNEKSTKKGKKRAREEEEDEADQVEAQATNEQTAAEAQVDVAVASTSKDTSTTAKHKKRQRPLLRVYQYNILDAYERLPGASTSSNNNEDADSPSSDSEDDDNGDEDDEARESSKVEADLVKSKIKAAKSLNDAIHTHVIRAKKRSVHPLCFSYHVTPPDLLSDFRSASPKKKHTPYMKIILSTCKLTEYETYLKSSANKGPKEYTIQLPPAKKSRSRTPKKRKHKKSTDEGEEGEVAQGPSSTQVVEKDNVKLTANQSEAFAKNVTKSKATQADDDALVKQDEKTLTSSNKKAKKRKADDMETQSTDATQKSSQLT